MRDRDADNEVLSPERSGFLEDVVNGLSATPKAIPAKYFYDEEGSHLFERICALEEYYPTRIEIGILRERAGEIAEHFGDGAVLIEPGAGATVKVRYLLDTVRRLAAYVPIDISGDHLIAASKELARDYPDLPVIPIVADFAGILDLEPHMPPGRRIGFFPGSTIGNFTPEQARAFLGRLRKLLGEKAGLVIGVDLQKDPAILEAAYDDSEGVTAAFNLNLLKRINHELGGDFVPERFRHKAIYNAEKCRVEMHLVSRDRQCVSVAGHRFNFVPGESIHTENSYKYTLNGFRTLAEVAGWRSVQLWTDSAALFSVHYLVAEA